MFPMLTASSITLTLPVDDSHTGHNCFSMGLGRRREGERVKRGREWEILSMFTFACQSTQASVALLHFCAWPKMAFGDPD